MFEDIKRITHPKGVLANIFVMDGKMRVGYYQKDSHKIITYVLGEKIQELPPDEILDTGKPIQQLDLAKVVVSPEKALSIAKNAAKEFKEDILKWVTVLQGNPAFYTLTGVTRSMKAVVVMVDAASGSVAHTSCETLAKVD